MPETTPVDQMTTSELSGCMEHAQWLLQRKHLLPRDLRAPLNSWLTAMQAERDDRAAQEARTRHPC